jgi:hypothetical protein
MWGKGNDRFGPAEPGVLGDRLVFSEGNCDGGASLT